MLQSERRSVNLRYALSRGGGEGNTRFDASSNYFPRPFLLHAISICIGALLTKLYLVIDGGVGR